VLAPEALLSVLAEKGVLAPYGVCGGDAGAPNRFSVRRGDVTIAPSPLPGKVSGFPLEPDDVVIMETSGGGGYGDPLERDPERVAHDVAEAVIDRAAAVDVYGVVLDADVVDVAATRDRRRALAAARIEVEIHSTDALDETRVSGIALPRSLAERLGAAAGSVVELVDPRGAPVRLWVSAIGDDADGAARVSPATLGVLGLAAGARVAIRLLVR